MNKQKFIKTYIQNLEKCLNESETSYGFSFFVHCECCPIREDCTNLGRCVDTIRMNVKEFEKSDI